MQQYFLVINLTKRQFIHPHVFGDGLKLPEFGRNGESSETFVERFINYWNKPEIFLDSVSKVDPNDPSRKIIFAGDAADAGNGAGFNMLFDAEIHGLFPVFDIR